MDKKRKIVYYNLWVGNGFTLIETKGSRVGVINGLSKYLIEKAIKKKKSLEDDDLRRDVLSHMHIAVRATCDLANMFDGQAKGHVFNKSLLNAIASSIYDKLGDMSQIRINEFTIFLKIFFQNTF